MLEILLKKLLLWVCILPFLNPDFIQAAENKHLEDVMDKSVTVIRYVKDEKGEPKMKGVGSGWLYKQFIVTNKHVILFADKIGIKDRPYNFDLVISTDRYGADEATSIILHGFDLYKKLKTE